MTIFTLDNLNRHQTAVKNMVNSIVLAFEADPIVRWMYPDDKQYQKNFPNFVLTFAAQAFESNTVFCARDSAGGAFWVPPKTELETDTTVELIQQTVSKTTQQEVFMLLEQMSQFHPHEPFWYLAILGVNPTQQNKGYGSILMQQVLENCDRHNQIAYLESSNPANLTFYKRHSFEIIGEIQVGNSPTMFPMIRHPQNILS